MTSPKTRPSFLDEAPPENLLQEFVVIRDHDGHPIQAKANYVEWSNREAFYRGMKKALKWVSIALLMLVPFALIEPFLFLVMGSGMVLFIIFGVGPYLHFKYWNEQTSFFSVEGTCFTCQKDVRFSPYLSRAFNDTFVVLCPDCGQTSRVERTVSIRGSKPHADSGSDRHHPS